MPVRASWHSSSLCHHPPALSQHPNSPHPVPGWRLLRPLAEDTWGFCYSVSSPTNLLNPFSSPEPSQRNFPRDALCAAEPSAMPQYQGPQHQEGGQQLNDSCSEGMQFSPGPSCWAPQQADRRKAFCVPEGLELKTTGLHQSAPGPATFASAGVSLWKWRIKLIGGKKKKKNKRQPAARNIEKSNPCYSSKNSSEPWLGRAAFQPHPNHKAEKTSMGSSFWIIIIIIMTGFSSQDSDSL